MKQDFMQGICVAAKRYADDILPKDVHASTRVSVEMAYCAGAIHPISGKDEAFKQALLAKDKTGDTLITIDAANVFYDLYERLSARQKTYVRDYIIRDADLSELNAELSRREFNVEEA